MLLKASTGSYLDNTIQKQRAGFYKHRSINTAFQFCVQVSATCEIKENEYCKTFPMHDPYKIHKYIFFFRLQQSMVYVCIVMGGGGARNLPPSPVDFLEKNRMLPERRKIHQE
jgi:hypothetical protein